MRFANKILLLLILISILLCLKVRNVFGDGTEVTPAASSEGEASSEGTASSEGDATGEQGGTGDTAGVTEEGNTEINQGEVDSNSTATEVPEGIEETNTADTGKVEETGGTGETGGGTETGKTEEKVTRGTETIVEGVTGETVTDRTIIDAENGNETETTGKEGETKNPDKMTEESDTENTGDLEITDEPSDLNTTGFPSISHVRVSELQETEVTEEEMVAPETDFTEAQVETQTRSPVKVILNNKGPFFTLMNTLNFINEEISTHLLVDDYLNRAIVVIKSKHSIALIRALQHHPKYLTLDELLRENELGSLQIFDVLKFEQFQPTRSRIEPSFYFLMLDIYGHIAAPSISAGLRNAFAKTEYHRNLHQPDVKSKIFMAIGYVLHLRIATQIILMLENLGLGPTNIINYLMYVVGLLDNFDLKPLRSKYLKRIHVFKPQENSPGRRSLKRRKKASECI